MVVEFTGTAEERRWREAMAFVWRDAPHLMPKILPKVKMLDPERIHALHKMFKAQATIIVPNDIVRARVNPERKTVGMLYIPKMIRDHFGIPFDIMIDETLDPNDRKTLSLDRHELTHMRQDIENRWIELGHEGREREAEDSERAFFKTFGRLR